MKHGGNHEGFSQFRSENRQREERRENRVLGRGKERKGKDNKEEQRKGNERKYIKRKRK